MNMLGQDALVLTHRGRFRRVLNLIKNPPPGWALRVEHLYGHITVTPDHQVLVDGVWRNVADLKAGDHVSVLAEHCVQCGAAFCRPHRLHRNLAFCSVACRNKWAAGKASEKLREILLESYRAGKRDPHVITAAARAAWREICATQEIADTRSPEGKQQQRIRAALTREAKGLYPGAPWVGEGETELAALLEGAGYNYTPQFALDGYNYDFKVGDVLIEVDGAGATLNTTRRKSDAKKAEAAEARGFRIVHVPARQVEQALAILANDQHLFECVDTEIVKITPVRWNRSTYTLQVEEDESYIGQGVVSHNCRPPENVYPLDEKWHWTSRDAARVAVAHCAQHHLWPAVRLRPWRRIVALGDYPLWALTGRRGILHWRGSPLPLRGEATPKVVPTLHPAYIMRQADWFSTVVRHDLPRGLDLPPEHYNLFPTIEELRGWEAKEFVFDFEWDREGSITLCGLADRPYHAMVVPFCPPFIEELKRIFEQATDLYGHNIVGADMAYFRRLGWGLRPDVTIHDTMLQQHLVMPDMPHSLAFTASVLTKKVFWKGHGEEQEDFATGEFVGNGAQWKTWESAEALPRECGGYGGCFTADEAFRLYNARDCDGNFQCIRPLQQLLERYEMLGVYRDVSLPVAFIAREMSARGLRIDNTRLTTIRQGLTEEIAELEQTLPEGLRPYEVPCTRNSPAPPNTFKPKTKECKGSKGAKHPPVKITFTQPGVAVCPTCGREVESGKMSILKVVKVPATKKITPWNSPEQIKEYVKARGLKIKLDLKTGRETTDKKARKGWARTHPEFVIVDSLKQKGTLKNSFAKSALEQVDRIYFNILVHGTAEGRWSTSGRRPGIDPNIQNQPKVIRKIYIPDRPDWGILSHDIVQGENMLTAWLAKDWDRWERLNTPGYDEHGDLACRIFNVPRANLPYEYRQIGKKINHGRNYGMGARKQLEELTAAGFLQFTERDVKEFIAIWQQMNAGTARWQEETTLTARRQGYLMNPFGRRRWFSDREYATKALAFLPASTLADMVIRMVIAHYPDWEAQPPYIRNILNRAIANLRLEVALPLPRGWDLRIQVHDELCLQGPAETHQAAARVTQAIMTQPWRELGGFKFRVDSKYSTSSWGECAPLVMEESDDEVRLPIAA